MDNNIPAVIARAVPLNETQNSAPQVVENAQAIAEPPAPLAPIADNPLDTFYLRLNTLEDLLMRYVNATFEESNISPVAQQILSQLSPALLACCESVDALTCSVQEKKEVATAIETHIKQRHYNMLYVSGDKACFTALTNFLSKTTAFSTRSAYYANAVGYALFSKRTYPSLYETPSAQPIILDAESAATF